MTERVKLCKLDYQRHRLHPRGKLHVFFMTFYFAEKYSGEGDDNSDTLTK